MEDLVRINFDVWSVLLAFGVFQGIFLMIILLSYRRNATVYLLSALLFVIVLNLLNYLWLSSFLFLEFPHLVHIAIPLLFLQGPIYYWYIKSLSGQFSGKRIIWHFVPFALAIIATVPFYGLSSSDKISALEVFLNKEAMPLPLDLFIFMAVQIVHSFIYIFKANSLLKKRYQQVESNSIKNKGVWLNRFGQLFLGYWAIDFMALVWFGFRGTVYQEVYYIIMLANTVLVNMLVFFAIRNNKVFNQILLNNWSDRYKNSQLSEADSKLHLQRIIEFMEKERAYLDAELSLPKLAKHLNMPSHQISQVLNLELEKSFYEFLNEYRFKEAKHRLLQPENKHLTILAIAFDSGFNNKNTFNKVFKKHEGLTPSQFIRQHN